MTSPQDEPQTEPKKEYIIKTMKAQLKGIAKEDMDEASFRMEYGVLLTGNEAKVLLDVVSDKDKSYWSLNDNYVLEQKMRQKLQSQLADHDRLIAEKEKKIEELKEFKGAINKIKMLSATLKRLEEDREDLLRSAQQSATEKREK